MKKVIFLLVFLITGTLLLANKGTYDETKYRNDLLAAANSWVGTPYLFGGGSRNGVDCSHYTYETSKSAGMNGITGKGYVDTAGLRSSGYGKNISYNDLKPGDSILMGASSSGRRVGHVMIVNRVLGNGKVEVIDAAGGSIGKVSVRTINFPPSRYAGVITATDTLIANGYMPVNQNGQVITPPPGSPAGSAAGSSGQDDSQKAKKSDYVVDLDAALRKYVDKFNQGGRIIGPSLIVILTFAMLIGSVYDFVKNRTANLEAIITDFAFELFKFVFFVILINNFWIINNVALSMCFKVAEAFGSKLSSYYVLNEIAGYYAQNVGVLIAEFARQSTGFEAIKNLVTFNMAVYVLLISLIIYTTLIFTYIIFQVTAAVMTYTTGTNYAFILLPAFFNRCVGQYVPNPFSIFFKCVAKLFFTIIIVAINLGILEELSKVLEKSVQSKGIQIWFIKVDWSSFVPAIDVMVLATYATAFTIVAFIMRKSIKMISTSI